MSQINYYAASAIFNGLFGAFLVYYIYLRNKQNPVNRSFVYFGIAVSGWSLLYALWAWSDNARIAEWYARCHMTFAVFIPATFFHFVCNFTGNFQAKRKWIYLIYALGIFYSISCHTPLMITGMKHAMFFPYWGKPGVLLLSHIIYFGTVILFSFSLLIKRLLQSHGMERRQTICVLIAFLIGFSGGSTNWFLWFDIPIPPVTNFFVGLMFAMIAYAIIRHGVMDVDMLVEILRSSRSATVGLVAASMNHELRNPLYIAKGKLESQLDAINRGFAQSDEKNYAVLSTTLQQLERAMDIMQRFSDFARPQIKQEKKESVVVRQVVEDVLPLVANEFEMNKIDFTSSLNGEVVLANRRQLEEVFFNLIMNACQALKPLATSPCISVSASHSNGNVNILIKDNGPGISAENQRRIFDPFFSTKVEKGSGLGLYITKQLIERNQGNISVKSKLGEGTVFTLEFKGGEHKQ